MLILSLVTIGLLTISYAMRRLRTAEVLLLLPFAFGSVLLPLFGTASFFDLGEGHLVLALFLAFEWSALTGVGLVYNTVSSQWRHSPIAARQLRSYGLVLRWCSMLLIIVLSIYAVKVLLQVVAAPNVSDYFIEKRIQAHAGDGLNVTDPLAYRAINFSMALLILTAAWRHFLRYSHVTAGNTFFLILLIVGGFSSLLEGNRSTLIVTFVTLMCFVYINRIISTKLLIASGAVFVLFFALSMQVFRLNGDFSLGGLELAFSWFSVYAFGSLVSFADFFDQHIATFWYAFDVGALKFGAEFAKEVGARSFFIIDYVNIGGLSTNVYSGYAVLYDYLGAWAILFILIKSILFYGFKWAGQRNFIGYACYIAILSSYPLTIYHEFTLTSLYYCLMIVELAVVLWPLAYIVRTFGGGARDLRYSVAAVPEQGA